MGNFWALFGVPIILLIIGLVLEYWIIQPIRNSQEYGEVTSKNRRDWTTATTKAIKRFRRQQPGYNGLLRRRNIKIEHQEVKRGHAVIRVAVSKSRFIWESLINSLRIEERFELIIDRTGDILAVKGLPVVEDPVSGLKESAKRASIQNGQGHHHPNPYAAYLYVLVGLLSGTGGIASGVFAYYPMNSHASLEDDPFFWVILLVALIGGIALAISADIHFQMDQAHAWQRLPLAVILGVIGGALGILISCVGTIIIIIVIAVWLDSKSTNTRIVSSNLYESGGSRYRRERLSGRDKDKYESGGSRYRREGLSGLRDKDKY